MAQVSALVCEGKNCKAQVLFMAMDVTSLVWVMLPEFFFWWLDCISDVHVALMSTLGLILQL